MKTGRFPTCVDTNGAGREIVETCAAFASAQGGRIYIGVRDNGTVVGVQMGKGTLESLANDIAQNTVPKLVPIITTVATNPTRPVQQGRRNMNNLARKWPAWPANGPRGPQAARLARQWRDWHEAGALRFFSGNEKTRETILAAKLAEKQPFETKCEKKVSRKNPRKSGSFATMSRQLSRRMSQEACLNSRPFASIRG